MRRFFLIFLYVVFVLFITKPTEAQRYAACDLCGLCQTNGTIQSQPQNWESCRKCLYPDASDVANDLDTLKITPSTNLPVPPQPGHQYTMVGCIQTDLSSFNELGAASGIVQKLLNIIFAVVGALAFLYFIYGSFIVLTSQAQPERINYGKRLVMGAIVGLAFTLLSVFIVNFIASGLLKIPGF